MGVLIAVEPDGCCGEAGECGQQEGPPEDAGDGVAVAGKAGEPVAAAVVEVYVPCHECREQDSEDYVQPYGPGILA